MQRLRFIHALGAQCINCHRQQLHGGLRLASFRFCDIEILSVLSIPLYVSITLRVHTAGVKMCASASHLMKAGTLFWFGRDNHHSTSFFLGITRRTHTLPCGLSLICLLFFFCHLWNRLLVDDSLAVVDER
jgi:hypothetical protein